jgi:hypothetical protein
MCGPVPLPYESRGFAQRAPPPGSFVSRGQADSEARPTRAGLRANLNLRFYVGPAWSLVPVPGRRPDRLSACRLVTGAVSPACACCLLKRRWGRLRVTSPTAPGIGVGAPQRTPARHGDEPGQGYARVRIRPDRDHSAGAFPRNSPMPAVLVGGGGLPLDTISLTRLLGQMPRSATSSLTRSSESRARRRRLDQMRSEAKLHSESCSSIGPEAPAPLTLPTLLSPRLTGVSLIYIRVRY